MWLQTFTFFLVSVSLVVGEWYVDPDVCNVTIPRDLFFCSYNGSHQCYNNTGPRCPKDFTVSVINLLPFNDILKDVLKSVMESCCNPCESLPLNTQSYKDAIEMFFAVSNNTEQSSFIYPVLGTKSTKKLFNRHFLPVIDIPKATLVTRKKNGTMIMESIMKSCFNLLPLLAVCILMAFASGVIIWFLDTWKNEEQFPRNFAYGIYEGFWSAFISMTTVGYGDKTPVSLLARVFGVLWILVGITICSIFTASLTAVITNAAQPLSTDIAGKNIVIGENRFLDATFTLTGGGIIYKGFLSDFISSAYARRAGEEDEVQKYDYQEIDFSSHDFTYGILVKEEQVFKYLEEFVHENRLFYTNCYLKAINSFGEPKKLSGDPFHPDNGVFLKALFIMLGI